MRIELADQVTEDDCAVAGHLSFAEHPPEHVIIAHSEVNGALRRT
jgi:hypothetical protein